MTQLLGILVAVLIFGLIVVIHEFGHFFVAKLQKIQVNEFAVGMGPRLLHFDKGGTTYSLRLFPIGGYCAMEGEDEESDNPNAFNKKPVWRRMTVVVAGALMNMILGFVLLIILACTYTKIPSTVIASFPEIEEDGETISVSTSETCGLQVGDQIVSIDGSHIFTTTDMAYRLSLSSENCEVVVKRDGEKVTLSDVTFYNEDTETYADFYVVGQSKNIGTVLSYACKEWVATAKLIWMSLIGMLDGTYGLEDLSGPVGTMSVISEAATAGETLLERVQDVLSLTVFITVNVAVFNLLPLPALDGGRLVFLVIEAIRRKPVPPETEGMIHSVGMILLLLLMVVVTFQDCAALSA